jgi:hypothetical protein
MRENILSDKMRDFLGQLFIVGIVFLVGVLYYNWKESKLIDSHRYTVAKTKGIGRIGNSRYIAYEFILGKRIYKCKKIMSKDLSMDEIDKFLYRRFIVQYHPDDPYNCRLLLDKHVTDSLLKPSINGWKVLPDLK